MAERLRRRRQVTLERLKELFEYLPAEGCFLRLTSHSGYSRGRRIFGVTTACGHRRIAIDGIGYFAHNLAWFYMTGTWPDPMVDHKDTDGHNNRWVNLREATQTENNANTRKRDGTSSRFKGVTYIPSRRRWQASLKVRGRSLFLGRHTTEEEAAAAYAVKAKEVFGEFARLA